MLIGDERMAIHIIDMPFYTKLQEVRKGQVTVTAIFATTDGLFCQTSINSGPMLSLIEVSEPEEFVKEMFLTWYEMSLQNLS